MDWFSLAAGEECPFDPPRVEPNPYWDSVSQLAVSTLCLLKNQFYRGHSILIYDPKHVSRPDQLTADEWSSFARDAHVAVTALVELFRPDHINIECLGNEMPHLHWHLIPRYEGDPRWGGPVWTTTREEMGNEELPAQVRARTLEDLRSAIARAQSPQPAA
jgi:diadenosine tetraphosphate (Ap4A) HIT family hydrolase